MIFIDSNIPMYLVGSDESKKIETARLVGDILTREERAVSSVEVLQEILHRYGSSKRLDAIQPCFDALTNLVDHIFPVGRDELESAKNIVIGDYGVSTRDALHIAVMRAHEVKRVLSFDSGFDRYPGIERVG